MELTGKKAVFLGDSITQGVGTSDEEYIYLNLLANKAGLCEVKNFGISGTRFAKQRASSGEPTSLWCSAVPTISVMGMPLWEPLQTEPPIPSGVPAIP